MMKLLKWFLVLSTIYSCSMPLCANELSSYTANVAIDNTTAADNPEVLKQGLLQVLTNVSGSTDLEKLPAIAQALKTPEAYLLKYTMQVTESKQRSSMQTYASSRVDSLLKTAGINNSQTAVSQEVINIRINNVTSVDEYAAIQNYLENLSSVQNLKLTKIKSNVLYLSVNTKNGQSALLSMLSQDNKLILEDQNNLNQAGEPLQFRWRREL